MGKIMRGLEPQFDASLIEHAKTLEAALADGRLTPVQYRKLKAKNDKMLQYRGLR
ncbi:hypothetical protein ACFQ1E_06845 [Sphingomonas canadensis]|uniref:DUF465 domain-containing protein n=1 Tax=Sphingomonas canadensis TaxID=1219257 RepID=A0ABW3H3P5_9SPHN|nr:hypothetical protein [Sphingomonas canadensis]MCW3835495.1 hypothetical protein [Sphingomonas canadensis]